MSRLILLAIACTVAAIACSEKAEPPSAAPPAPATEAPPPVELTFVYGSEKKEWLADALATFNATTHLTPSGRPIKVRGIPMGSGESLAEILAGTSQPDAWSPASSMYLPMLNDAWALRRGASGFVQDIVGEGRSLALSPVTIAMWKPMAEALGWPGKPVGWSDILRLSTDPNGWATLGHPEWGHFKFGHTHPEFSNSGHLGVLAEAYAAVGTTRGLTAEQLADPKTIEFLRGIEESIVHYGKSTGFFAENMLNRGPGYLSAAILYENLVVQSYKHAGRAFDLVAIYPKEGTFWIDNPFVILNAPWVDFEKRAAAQALLDALLSRPYQERAMAVYGFRPADPAVAVGAPIDAAHGVDPKQPQTLLEVPPPAVLQAALQSWRAAKKPADVVFVYDKSGSMQGEPMEQARAGGLAFLDMLDPRDRVTLLLFDNRVPTSLSAPVELSTGREGLKKRLKESFADGGTSLYDAVALAFQEASALAAKNPKRNYGLVVLSDGRDEHSKSSLDNLKSLLQPSAEQELAVRIFTIAYGPSADPAVLKEIADAGGGGVFKGDPGTITQVYRDLAAFF